MNPPFERLQDIDHVRHAYEHLNPGGKLVSIMSESPFFNSRTKGAEFREWFEQVGGYSQKVEPGAFNGADSEKKTGVSCRIIVIEKPW